MGKDQQPVGISGLEHGSGILPFGFLFRVQIIQLPLVIVGVHNKAGSNTSFKSERGSAGYDKQPVKLCCTNMDKVSVKRWTKIGLRTLHLLAVAGVGGGILFGLEQYQWINYWWLAVVSGALMMVIDIVSNPVWIVQVRGLVIFLKLILLVLLGHDSSLDRLLLIVIIIISAIISHAPSKLRYYSVYHKKVISSANDSKG